MELKFNAASIVGVNTLIVIPTYNEAHNITKLLTEIYEHLPNIHVLFIDDGSADGTVSLIKKHSEFGHKIFILERSHKLGLGSAYVAGFKWAFANNMYQFICQMDADLSHDASYLCAMLLLIETHDLVIGSRYIKNGGIENWTFIRKLISRFGSWYARTILSISTKDLTGGFNVWRAEQLKKIVLNDIKSEGYSFQIELKYRASKAKFRIVEYPIIFKDRMAGKSKMSLKICVEAFYRVLQMKFRK